MKCRIFKKPDDRLIYSWPTSKYQGNPDFAGCKFPKVTEGLPFIDVDESDLQDETGRDWISHGPLTVNGEFKKENISFDENWSKHLMPDYVIKIKEIKAAREAVKSETDPVKAIVASIELDELKEKEADIDNRDPFWTQKALDGLARAETPKPEIEAKLRAKLAELGG